MRAPSTYPEMANELAAAAVRGVGARISGGGTKAGWAAVETAAAESPAAGDDVRLSTLALGGILEHNTGDFTAVLQAGVRVADAQAAFGDAGQMLAVDPPLGEGDAATVGGVFATADSGPLRHRYGAPRDLVLGMTVALSDGTVARSGGKVIKNVAGYDLAKVFTGSLGTLGAIVEVVVRLHPLPRATATAVGASDDPAVLGRTALALAHAPRELDALDLVWESGSGRVLARVSGAAASERAAALARRMDLDAHVEGADEAIWAEQRARQRSASGAVVRISALPSELERTLRVASSLDAAVVARAGLGLAWAQVAPDARAVAELRERLAPFPCVLLDAPAHVRADLGPPEPPDAALAALERRLKERFDPGGVCNPRSRVA